MEAAVLTSRGPVFWGMRRWVALLWLLCAGGLAAEEFRTFSLESGEALLERAAPSASAFLRAFRSNPATGRWEVDVVVTNGTPDRLQPPVILRFERAGGVAPGIGGAASDADGLPFLDLTVRGAVSGMDPGTALPAFTLELGDGRTRPDLEVAIYSRPPPGLAVVRTLDAAGLPVEGVTVREVGPGAARSKVSGRGGWVTVEGRPEVVGWEFSRPGSLPAFRSVAALVPRQVVELPSVRMIPADPTGTTVLPVEALPVLLPAGWSPMAAAVSGAGTLALTATAPLPVGREAAWVRWESAGRVWRLRERVAGTGAAAVELSVADPGLHVLAVPDPDGPGIPGPGGILVGGTVGRGVPEGLEAVGEVTPPVRAASRVAEQVTTRATVRLTSRQGPLTSGQAIPCEVVEEYRLRDGTRRVLPSYGLVLVGYRETGDEVPGRLTARFPLRPFQLLDGEELLEAVVRVEVLGPGAFVSGVVGAEGGRVGLEGIEWTIPAGVMAGPEAVRLRIPGLGESAEWAPPGLVVERAVELVVGSPVAGGEMQLGFGPLPAASRFVLARAVFDEGRHGFQPVARFSTDEGGAGTFDEPSAGPRLPGVDGGGQYVLFRVAAPEVLVAGVARDAAGQPQPGLMVRRGPWTAFSGADGSYRLLAPAGPGQVTLLDPRTGDSGVAAVEVAVGTPLLTADVQAGAAGPRVVRVSPPDGATDVAVVTPVEVRFSRALDPTTVGADGVVLLGAGAVPVPTSLRLSLDGLSVQLLPVAPLAGGVEHRIRIADRVRDREGRALEGIAEFGFTTRAFVLDRGLAGQVTVYEPGATNLTEAVRSRVPAYDPERDGDGVVIEGSQGTAEPDGVVILVNESTGETATTRADVDGSFVGLIRGDVNDFISAVLVNANGTRNQLPANRQRFDDGTVGLFGSGGTLRSTGEGVPVDLIVEPGSVPGKTLFKLESLPTATFGQLVEGRLPEGAGPILGAFELTESGDPLSSPADISVPFRLADIGLPPGELPDDVSFLVVMPLRVDGRVVHQIVDTATYEPEDAEGGRLRTASPPFVGMLARKLAALARSAGMSVVTTPKVASNNDNPHKGETAVFGILPLIARGPLKVGGFARVVTRNADGTPTIVGSLPGATVRVMKLVDDQDPDTAALEFDGDLVSITDERGNFGFFYRPSEANETRMLLATHPRFPFQRPRTGAFTGERRGTTVVNADLMFVELPPDLAAVDDIAPPQVTVGHTPDLPRAGSGEGAGADVFVVAVDDREVGLPELVVQRVENLRGETLDVPNPLTGGQLVGNEPARKVRRYRLAIPGPGRVILQASVADATGKQDIAAHSVSFGVTRPPVEPGDPADTAALRVTFAWPPEGGTNLPALTPVRLRFNRSLPTALIETPPYDWLAFSSGHFVRRIQADSDRRELTVYYDGPASGPVRLTVGSGITGESGRPFDQRSDEDGSQLFALSFQQAIEVTELLEGGSGAGAALLGRFAYTLEREGNGGRVQVWDLEDPADPRSVRNIRVGYPTAMALIPGQRLPTETNHLGEILSVCVPMNLLAVFTGHANEPKYLQLGRIDRSRLQFGPRLILSGGGIDGDGLPSVAEGVTGAESISQIVKAKWDPPFLGYYELGADVTSVKLIDLHAYWLVEREDGVLDRFGAGSLGVDANGDGDYCDSGDRAPAPRRDPLQPPGMAFSFAPSGARERWDDFDFHSGLGLVVTVGRFLDGQTPPRFSVVLAAAQEESLEDAFV